MRFSVIIYGIGLIWCVGLVSLGCGSSRQPPTPNTNPVADTSLDNDAKEMPPNTVSEQEREVRSLIEQLVFSNEPASEEPLISPGLGKIVDSVEGEDTGENSKARVQDEVDTEEYRKKFETCRKAYAKLIDLKEIAVPYLVEHLEDRRQSIPFRNHFIGQSVGDACYWNLFHQFQDRPEDYSAYGLMRMGRDGELHQKPYWKGTPFGDDGGLVNWLEKNKALTYTQKQLKCLRWLLDQEIKIGASDADSYFVNILPLEIQILERRFEAGENVRNDLEQLKKVRDNKIESEIPPKLLPDVR